MPRPSRSPRPASSVSTAGRAGKIAGRARRVRLTADDRRRTLVAAAGALLTAGGVDAVQIPEVARRAGVTRQLVYRFFANRQALLLAVLEDFAEELTRRFGAQAALGFPGTLTDATGGFLDAVCDTIEAKGVGPWRLLDAKGADAEVARLATAIDTRLLAPWHARIARTTGAAEREVAALARMIAAAGRAVLELWHAGVLTRAEAVRNAARGVGALLAAFTVAPAASPARPRAALRRRRVAR